MTEKGTNDTSLKEEATTKKSSKVVEKDDKKTRNSTVKKNGIGIKKNVQGENGSLMDASLERTDVSEYSSDVLTMPTVESSEDEQPKASDDISTSSLVSAKSNDSKVKEDEEPSLETMQKLWKDSLKKEKLPDACVDRIVENMVDDGRQAAPCFVLVQNASDLLFQSVKKQTVTPLLSAQEILKTFVTVNESELHILMANSPSEIVVKPDSSEEDKDQAIEQVVNMVVKEGKMCMENNVTKILTSVKKDQPVVAVLLATEVPDKQEAIAKLKKNGNTVHLVILLQFAKDEGQAKALQEYGRQLEVDNLVATCQIVREYNDVAMDVKRFNPWFAYTPNVHTISVLGLRFDPLDELSQRTFSRKEASDFCENFLGNKVPTNGNANFTDEQWVARSDELSGAAKSEHKQAYPGKKELVSWIDERELKKWGGADDRDKSCVVCCRIS